jgi:hypothetical protein
MFELTTPTPALLTSLTNRVEKHGEDDVPGMSLGLKITTANTILDLLSPTLRPTLYTKPEGQEDVPGVEPTTPLLRTRGIEVLNLAGSLEGWTVTIEHGIDDQSAIVAGDCKVDAFRVAPKEGGTVELMFRVSTSDLDAKEAGLLWSKNHQEVSILVTKPKNKGDGGDAIDGSVDAFLKDHPNAGRDDLLSDAGGGPDNDEADGDGTDTDVTPESALAAAVAGDKPAKAKKRPIGKAIARAEKAAAKKTSAKPGAEASQQAGRQVLGASEARSQGCRGGRVSYDEPPDPEPNPCPFCDAELGHGDGCDHCEMAARLAKTEGDLSTLRHRLTSRASWICATDPQGPLSPRFMEAIGLILDLAGLPLPDDFRKQALAAMTGEYGEYPPYEADNTGRGLGSYVPADELVCRFFAMAHLSTTVAARPYFAEVLDAKPATHGDQLWWGDDDTGVPRVWAGVEKRLGGRASSTQWGITLRQSIEKALNAEAGNAVHWLEFYGEYLQRPEGLTPKHDPRRVRSSDQLKVSFVVGVDAYTAYVGRHKSDHCSSQGLGFGGAEFTVRLDDGREFFTDNNWSRGTVPPKLRKLLRSNALFVRDARVPAAADEGAAA